MKHLHFLSSVVFLLVIASLTFAQPRPTKVIGAGLGAAAKTAFNVAAGNHVTLSKDTTYILTGFYYIDSLASLTIEPGTVIMGDSATYGTLIIRRGGIINANGSRFNPIVFTSSKPAGQRVPGQWGGVVILGSAPTNKPDTKNVEGIDVGGQYGGVNPDDSSGVFRYVRIEYPGIVISLNNEINGLTMGGVGRKTVIEYVQVSYSNDDSYEWFGGTVNVKHLVAFGGTDDDFDTDFGFIGKVQYGFAKRDPNRFDIAGQSNGFESDNDDPKTLTEPFTNAIFSNMTMVGPQSDTGVAVNSKFEFGAVLRRNTRTSIHNSVITGYPFGISLRDDSTASFALTEKLQIRNVSLQARTSVLSKHSSVTIPFDFPTFYGTTGWGNMGPTPRQTSDIGLVDAFTLNNPDPRPSASSEPATAGTGYKKWGLDVWFDSVSYRGAFDPSKPMDLQWTSDWTNFTPQQTDYSSGLPSNFIVVDGMKDAFYGTLTGPLDGYIQMRSSAYNNNGAPKSDADLSAKVWTAWDNNWFYLYTEVKDDTISDVGTNSYQDDGLELKFDAQAKDSVANTIFGVNLTILGGPGSDSLSSSGIPELAKMYSRKIITDGYALELAIKWSAIGTTEKVSVAVDSVFGLAINIHDDDYLVNPASGNARQASVMWSAVMDDAVWNTPKYLGTVVFLSGNKLLFDDKNNMTGRTNPYNYDGTDAPLSVKLADQGIPTQYSIEQNYPNPFNPSTTIRYELPVTGLVTLKVFNIVGQEVSTVVNGMQEAGRYEARFNAAQLSSGVYFYTIHAGNYLQTKKMMLLK